MKRCRSVTRWQRGWVAAAVFALWLGGVLSGRAVVDASSQTNTNAPADGAPWANVAIVNKLSGIYVGGGWIVTASHVGAANANLNGVSYHYDGTMHRLTNSDGTSTDMIVFHLSTVPPLPSLLLATATPASYSQVDMIGYGRIAGSGQTNIGTYTGFYWTTDSYMSRGNNKVDSGGVITINAGYGNIRVFTTTFTSPGTTGPGSPTSDEAHAAVGDSGGAVFHLNGSTWQLAGMMDAISTRTGQAGATSVYGDTTACADIATYRNQIVALITPVTIPSPSIARSGTNVLVCWPDTGITYNLAASTNLVKSNWTVLMLTLISTNGQLCAKLPAIPPARYFRLQKP